MQAALIDQLLEIMPEGISRFAFQNSGSEAVENAIKVARAHTKRSGVICFEACCSLCMMLPAHSELPMNGTTCRTPSMGAPLAQWL